MVIGFNVNPFKDIDFEVTERAVRHCHARGVRCVTAQDFGDNPPKVFVEGLLEEAPWTDADLVISIGGDGSFLTTVQEIYRAHLPLIGVNRGSLGFMNEIAVDQLLPNLDQLIAGAYIQTTRMMLHAQVTDQAGAVTLDAVGLNDVVLARGGYTRIVPIHLHLDGQYVETVPADGMIVSTPVGSTGYAMAAGGAIIDPAMEVLQITPICPHTLHNRSYIVHPDTDVMLTLGEDYPFQPLVSVDGRHNIHIGQGHHVRISRAATPMHIIRLNDRSTFNELPAKLNARGGYRT